MDISQYFMRGDLKGAIQYMKEHEEFKEFLPSYVSLFEEGNYLDYDVPEKLNDILRLYQIYYRNIFYFGKSEKEEADELILGLKGLLGLGEEMEEEKLSSYLQSVFEEKGYHALFGKTQGFFGPYVWKETVPTLYTVELPEGGAEYKVNILKGFVFRSWMDYLTFGRFGTGGWASPDGTINCIEKAYDFDSERFLVSLLKHEAQHTRDIKKYADITQEELEYRAKLVELHYSNDPGLVQKFISEGRNDRAEDSHALASYRIMNEFKGVDLENLASIQEKALVLFDASTKEMDGKYKTN